MTSRDAVEERERGKREEGSSERYYVSLRGNDSNNPPPPSEWLFQPTADNKPTLGLHGYMHT